MERSPPQSRQLRCSPAQTYQTKSVIVQVSNDMFASQKISNQKDMPSLTCSLEFRAAPLRVSMKERQQKHISLLVFELFVFPWISVRCSLMQVGECVSVSVKKETNEGRKIQHTHTHLRSHLFCKELVEDSQTSQSQQLCLCLSKTLKTAAKSGNSQSHSAVKLPDVSFARLLRSKQSFLALLSVKTIIREKAVFKSCMHMPHSLAKRMKILGRAFAQRQAEHASTFFLLPSVARLWFTCGCSDALGPSFCYAEALLC